MRIVLDIETGSGNYAKAAEIGTYQPNYGLFWAQVGIPPIANLHNQSASDVANQFDKAIQAMHDDTAQFTTFTEPVRRDYDKALEFLTNWRNECRLHPNARVNIPA
jgi:hypothetical protein